MIIHFNKIINTIILILFVVVTLFLVVPVSAYVMSSTNYRVQFDSVNTGGALGTSSNYKIEDTLGEVGSGAATSTSYNLYAGYQQMDQETFLILTIPDAVTLLPNIGGLTGGVATGISTTTVLTNNDAGYTLYVHASTSPAMQSGSNNILNYVTSSNPVDYTWSVASNSSGFGFTPEGADIIDRYLDNGSICNQTGGTDNLGKCWDYFSTTLKSISVSGVSNSVNPATTTIRLQAESGNQNVLPSGEYTATIIVTAVVN